MVDRRRACRIEQAIERRRIGDVDGLERSLPGDPTLVPRREVVDYDDGAALAQERIDDVGTDEAGPPGDDGRAGRAISGSGQEAKRK